MLRPFPFFAAASAVIIFLLVGCDDHASPATEHYTGGHTMGTSWSLRFISDRADDQEVRQLTQKRLDELEQVFSNWLPDSEVEKFNASDSADWYPVSKELVEVVETAQEVSRKTNGAFDVTLAPLVKLWGFAGGQRVKGLPSEAAILEAASRSGWQKLEVRLNPPALRKRDPGLMLNVSALVEGYAVDDLAEMLRQYGITDFLLDIGGEIFASGRRLGGQRWTVGVQVPGEDKTAIVSQIELEGQALATSGVYRQFFEWEGHRYPHVLDGRTGRPVTHRIESVSVIADKCVNADVWATALLVLGPEGRVLAESEQLSTLFLEAK